VNGWQDKESKALSPASLLELGLELRAAEDLDGSYRVGHASMTASRKSRAVAAVPSELMWPTRR
jgi:hypothetical protein